MLNIVSFLEEYYVTIFDQTINHYKYRIICFLICWISRFWQFDDEVHEHFVSKCFRWFHVLNFLVFSMSDMLISLTVKTFLNICLDFLPHIWKLTILSQKLYCFRDVKMILQWFIVMFFDVFVDFVFRYL